ncbi:tRNA lysidine(34) synthetase TilS [Cohnella silvisoli]|uniref:tRNA(Ile)-lysidine synthase n=1 Tax=Cohnella silvisoli TaxID=2873699 RepID=A0ABV1L3U3_9BACL|nr:tRNA lysidine(34) synthetase TilS [Cohnella silvisoli]MCD9026301.1 tRNA lysidine(34) synthetase TilS [Cohnella silvisoli]
MQPQDDWTLRIMAEARAAGWWHKDSKVVAAVSGGPDSMALLCLLKTMAEKVPFHIVVAHVNHQFRGAESDAEAEMVGRVAKEWGLAFEMAELDIPNYIADTGMNAQTAAREKRYQFLKKVAEHYSSHILLTGHHADDQAETVLMRLIRGTGPGGLAGIPMRRKEEDLELIRPLLRITKCELLDYCKRNGVPYAVDSSNADRHYFRNEVRLGLIPVLEKFNPKLKASLVRLAEMAAADDDYMEAQTLEAFNEGVIPSGKGFRLERRRFRGLHVALQRRLIKLILNCSSNPRQMLDFKHIDEILAALSRERPSVTRLDIGDGWVMKREYDELYIGPSLPESLGFDYSAADTIKEIEIAETGDRILLERLEGSASSEPANRQQAYFDESQLKFPLRIRSRLPGDFMHPYGLNGTKKVQDMFVDAKLPRSRRDTLPLVVDGEGRVLWIPGMRRSRYALVTADTRTILRITYVGGEN